jgi:phage-related protein
MSNARPPIALLSILANRERHAIASGEPFLQLMDIAVLVDDTTTEHVRLARNIDDITFDANDGNGPQVYQAFNFEMGECKISSDGSVPEVTFTASNVMRILQSTIETYGGLSGSELYLYAFNTTQPAGEPDLAMQFTIKQATCNAKNVQIKCGAPSPMRRLFPTYKYWPNSCIWRYKSGVGCTYSGTMTTCSKTIDGDNGCKAHFPSAVLPFGGFPGIDTNGITAAGVV